MNCRESAILATVLSGRVLIGRAAYPIIPCSVRPQQVTRDNQDGTPSHPDRRAINKPPIPRRSADDAPPVNWLSSVRDPDRGRLHGEGSFRRICDIAVRADQVR